MVEHIPQTVENGLLYFHTAGANGSELSPFLNELTRELPRTYIWSGDGPIARSPQMQSGSAYASGEKRYWFTFPMQDSSSAESFRGNIEAMGAVLACCGAYINVLVDGIVRRFDLRAEDIVLCGHQHGSCAALAAAMMRKGDPYRYVVLLDPFPLETYYLEHEHDLPATTVVCVDTVGLRTRNKDWLGEEVDRLFRSYGMKTETVTLPEGGGAPDGEMFGAVIGTIQKLQ